MCKSEGEDTIGRHGLRGVMSVDCVAHDVPGRGLGDVDAVSQCFAGVGVGDGDASIVAEDVVAAVQIRLNGIRVFVGAQGSTIDVKIGLIGFLVGDTVDGDLVDSDV